MRKNPTHEEFVLWQNLKASKLGVRFKRQHPISMYIADCYCHELKMVIEVDGSIHNLKEVQESDIVREDNIKSLGIIIIRFTNTEIRNNIEDVIKKLENIINEITTNDGRKEK